MLLERQLKRLAPEDWSGPRVNNAARGTAAEEGEGGSGVVSGSVSSGGVPDTTEEEQTLESRN
jgi:hypothetical protein